MGGKTYRAIFWGGGETYHRVRLQNQFWRPHKVTFAWSVPVSSKENNRAKTNGGGKRIIGGGGGVQNRFWEGVLWYVFPSPEFSTPLCFSLNSRLKTSISLENANLDLQNSPWKKKIGPWWVAHLQFSLSLDIFNPGGRSWIFSIFRPLIRVASRHLGASPGPLGCDSFFSRQFCSADVPPHKGPSCENCPKPMIGIWFLWQTVSTETGTAQNVTRTNCSQSWTWPSWLIQCTFCSAIFFTEERLGFQLRVHAQTPSIVYELAPSILGNLC